MACRLGFGRASIYARLGAGQYPPAYRSVPALGLPAVDPAGQPDGWPP